MGAIAGLQAAASPLVVETVFEDKELVSQEITGSAQAVDRPVNLASTFKILLAWVALEEGCVGLETRRHVADRHVPGAPRAIGLREALFYSSNDYFIGLLSEEVMRRLPDYIRRSGLAAEVPANWLAEGPRAIVRGGALRASPRQNHQFLVRLARGELASRPEILSQLEEACRWPPEDGEWIVCGKTGVWGGAVWFNGWARNRSSKRLQVRTVFIPGRVEQRARAIELFYEGVGLRWRAEWSRWLKAPDASVLQQ